MKAYKDKNGKIRLFRPDMNMARMNRSTERIALPVHKRKKKHENILTNPFLC
jgi:branched-subunit amino acid aminotransferase/4-amino-4-deoxychorismate lyase